MQTRLPSEALGLTIDLRVHLLLCMQAATVWASSPEPLLLSDAILTLSFMNIHAKLHPL